MYDHIAYVCVYQCINVNVCMSMCTPARMSMTSIVCVYIYVCCLHVNVIYNVCVLYVC